MSIPTTTYRIFLSSPGDVPREREAMLGVVNVMNRILNALLPDEGIRVELIRWEDDVAPQIADGPQPVVNEQVESYEIFLGVLAKRFGTPTGVAGSGTEEEYRRAYDKFSKHGSPWIAFYFNTKFKPPQGSEEERQFERVKAFKAELTKKGITGEYNGADLFINTVLPKLLQIVGILVKQERRARTVSPPPSHRSGWKLEGQPVPIGERVKVADIGQRDACYLRRSKYIGQSGVILEAQRFGPWLRGTFQFDTPLIEGDDGRYTFLEFQVADIHGERVDLRVDDPDVQEM